MADQRENAIINVVINGQPAIRTFRELNQVRAEQLRLVQNLNRNTPEYAQQQRRLEDLNAAHRVWSTEIRDNQAAIDRLDNEMTQAGKNGFFDKVKSFFSKESLSVAAGSLLAGGVSAGIGALKGLASSVIETYSRFEKMDAVLTNTLGDQGSSRRAMSNLQKFAAETPFSLEELTESYIKFVNRGILPTMDELRAFGDLASSQGKSFDQLTEAILDAVTGEYERLKEFGIRAQKNGDMVSLSFKGITMEVKNSEDAIKSALIEFGRMDGVAGGMEKISQTVGGAISNLGDNWDRVLNAMGNNTGGFVFKATGYMNDFLEYLADRFTSFEDKLQQAADSYADDALKSYNKKKKDSQVALYEGTKLEIQAMTRELAQLQKRMDSATDDNTTNEQVNQIAERYNTLNARIAEEKAFLAAVDKQAETENKAKAIKEEQERREREKKAKEDAEKLKKQREKETRELHTYQKNLKDAQAEVNKFLDAATNGTSENLDAQLKVINDKYQKLIDRLKNLSNNKYATVADKKSNKDAIAGLENERDSEQDGARAAFGYDSFEKTINDDAQQKLNETKEALADHLINEEEFAANEFEIEQQRLSDLYDVRMLYGMETLDLETKFADDRIKNDKRSYDAQMKMLREQTKGEEEYNRVQKAIQQERAALAETGIQMLTAAFGRSKGVLFAQLALEKAIAIGRIVSSLGTEVAGYYAHPASILSFGVSGSILAGLAQVRAGYSIANIVASGVMQGINISQSDNKYADGGLLPGGPSHSQGGLKLIDPYGMVFGEVEGGEPILSRKTYANNKSLVDALLGSNGRQLNLDRIQAATINRERRISSVSPNEAASRQGDIANSDRTGEIEKMMALFIEDGQKTRNAISKMKFIFSNRLFAEEQEKLQDIRNEANA